MKQYWWVLALTALVVSPQSPADWPAYGGTVEQTRYSTLRQINARNVAQLEVAWTYDTGETGGLQTQPIVVGGVLYGISPSQKIFALDAATGAALWTFDPRLPAPQARGPNRGVTYWSDGSEKRIFAAGGDYLHAIDATTGVPITTFGEGGRVDLRNDLGRDPQRQSVRLTSPGIVYKDLLIVGGRVNEGLPASPGHVRAYDVRTGKLRWIFHTVPHPGEFGHDTWPAEAWTYSGGANNWAGMALDDARGIVYVPTGSAAPDFYGAGRTGDNLFANSLIALNAATGTRIWHFQVVRHDTWDRDLPSPPTLARLKRNGSEVDAVIQTTKHGYVFAFDRATGKPLFPIEYRRFPASDVPGEALAPAQPIPVLPRPMSRERLTEAELTKRTPEAREWARKRFSTFRSSGPFTPLTVGRDTVVFPGFDGGAEWGGSAFDRESGILYVNANDLAWTGALAPNDVRQSGRALYQRECSSCHRDNRTGSPPAIPSLVAIDQRRTRSELTTIIQKGAGRMAGYPNLQRDAIERIIQHMITGEEVPAPAVAKPPSDVESRAALDVTYRFTGYNRFMDPDGYPAVAAPWGTLNAIDMNTGKYVWTVPLGEHPKLAAQGLTNTGSENYGGPIVTAGGLVFIGATIHDRKFRAFDKATGTLLWSTTLPFAGNATPATYEINGRQFVVIAAGGGKSPEGGSGGAYVAFALPAGR